MKSLAKFILTATLVVTPLCAKENIKIHFNTMNTYNRTIPAINFTFKSKEKSKVAVILSYANSIFNFGDVIIEHFKITDTRLVFSYKF